MNFHAIPASFRFMRPRLPNESRAKVSPARTVAVGAVVLALAACATDRSVPVEDRPATPSPSPPAVNAPPAPPPAVAAEIDTRPPTYTVKRGDTLAQIALDNGLDYREVAAWNSIDNPNLIRVGQVLRLTAPGTAASGNAAGTAAAATPMRPPPSAELRPQPAPGAQAAGPSTRADGMVKSSPKALREPYSEQAMRDVTLASNAPAPVPAHGDTLALATPPGPRSDTPRPAAPETGEEDRIDWTWPVKGKVVGGFSESANLKGIDIAGNAGQPVLASAPGRVVYAGSGLRGYGKLIIIKHNKTYLSAYAHNREILVKEGDQVTRGQKIAEMGNTDTDQVKLHFEIRRMGKPMDPARYLPPA
ncbi:MAG: peptidoglycan DD-metalloendopeptidase family protein [Casimicrobiaceae bacterium]